MKKCSRRYKSAGYFNTSSAGAFISLILFVLCSLTIQGSINTNNVSAHSISMTSSGAQNLSVVPGSNGSSNGTTIASDSISITTTCPAGYNLSMSASVNDNKLYLGGSNSSSSYFSPANGTTALNNATNTWGYYSNGSTVPTGSTAFSAVPAFGSTATIKNSSNTSDSFNVYYGVSVSNGLTPGTYKMKPDANNNNKDGAIIYYLTMDESCLNKKMQTMSESDCTTTAMVVDDTRDNQEYTIQRLADGNCWMMTNLNLGATTLTKELNSSNTHMPSSNTISASTFNSWNRTSSGNSESYTEPKFSPVSGTDSTNGMPYGTLYNYCAASAGTYCYTADDGNSDARYDLCPAGWRMPTGGYPAGEFYILTSNNSYSNATKLRNPISSGGAAFVVSGTFTSGSPSSQGTSGWYWSSTKGTGGYDMYNLVTSTVSFNSVNTSGRYYGGSLRCIKMPQYTIQFNANGGSGSMASQPGYVGGYTTLNSNAFTAPANKPYFASWNTVANGSGAGYKDGDSVANLTASGDTITLYAQWSDKQPIQTMARSDCDTTAKSVIDIRDGSTYEVQQLADGNCWMMNNLNLGATTISSDLTSGNTNMPDDSIITATDFNAWNRTSSGNSESYTAPKFSPVSGTDSTSQTSYGTLYNYCAASAKTFCYSNGNGNNDAKYDLCPAGWRMPTGSSMGEFSALYSNSNYNSITKMRASIANNGAAFALPGYFTSSSSTGVGSNGYYWSSTRADTSFMWSLSLTPSSVNPTYTGNNRSSGNSIRCIQKETRTIADVTYMQDVNSGMVKNTANGATATLRDKRDNQDYTVAKIGDFLWMTRNLAIGCNGSGSNYGSSISSKSLTSATSNVSSNWSTPTANLNTNNNSSTSGYTTKAMKCSSTYGAWYNYVAATAGTITGNNNTNVATYDICPAGWHLPTQTEVTNVISSASVFSPVSGGDYYRGSNQNTSLGYWWSNTTLNGSTDGRWVFYWNGENLQVSDGRSRYYGEYVRCVKSV